MSWRDVVALLRQTLHEWSEDKASRLAAALAYYTLFSLAPLLVVLILTVGLVLGQEAAQGQLVGQVQSLVGPDAAKMIQGMIDAAGRQRSGGVVASLIGLGALILGALGLFGALQDALNTVWDVEQRPTGGFLGSIKAQVLKRVTSFVVVLLVGVVLIAAFLASAALSTVAIWFGDAVPGLSYGWFVVNFVVSFAVISVLFAIIYKVLPDVEIAWSDVWIGAAGTSLLFVIGNELIGLYLGRAGVGSIYGAAGSLVVLLVWIYYSAQLLLLGAEFTQVYANKYGSRPGPARDASFANQETRAASGAQTGAETKPTEREAAQPQRAGLFNRLFGAYGPLLVGVLLGMLLGSLREPEGEPDGQRGKPDAD